MAMYHYRECGLDNVWLVNGFKKYKTAAGPAVSFEDIDGLHRTIARALAEKPARLKANEFRFLRTELDLSQKALGEIIGASEQAIARWERGVTPVPPAEDRFLRALYREYIEGNARIRDLVERLGALDEREYRTLKLRHDRRTWTLAA